MKAQRSCDESLIQQFLDHLLSDVEIANFEAHLSQCARCRQKLTERTAETTFWESTSTFLQDDIGEPSPLSTLSGEGDTVDHYAVDRVLDSLSPTDDPRMLGRLDGYEISGVVGCGGMGVVLKGHDPALHRVVAIKVMAPHLATRGAARKRFAREAQAAAAITHENVIEIYGVSEANGLPYLVMPFARGTSLQKRIDDRGFLPTVEVLRVGAQIAAGLSAAHQQGLVHRDIKPANILMRDGIERLVITDFGLARAADDASVTRTGMIAGTPQYMSPEQAAGDAIDHRSDLFSLGSLLYTMCTGRIPFRADSALGVLRRITDEEPTPIRQINPETPPWLEQVIEKLHSKSVDGRYQSSADVETLLAGCLAHLQNDKVALPSELGMTQRLTVPARLFVSAALIAFCLLSVFFVTQNRDFASRKAPVSPVSELSQESDLVENNDPSAEPLSLVQATQLVESETAKVESHEDVPWQEPNLALLQKLKLKTLQLASDAKQDFAISADLIGATQ